MWRTLPPVSFQTVNREQPVYSLLEKIHSSNYYLMNTVNNNILQNYMVSLNVPTYLYMLISMFNLKPSTS